MITNAKKDMNTRFPLLGNPEEPYATYLFRRIGILSQAETSDIINTTN